MTHRVPLTTVRPVCNCYDCERARGRVHPGRVDGAGKPGAPQAPRTAPLPVMRPTLARRHTKRVLPQRMVHELLAYMIALGDMP